MARRALLSTATEISSSTTNRIIGFARLSPQQERFLPTQEMENLAFQEMEGRRRVHGLDRSRGWLWMDREIFTWGILPITVFEKLTLRRGRFRRSPEMASLD